MAEIIGRQRNVWLLVAFVALVLGGGTLIGILTRPDGWYTSLAKPAFNPPSWVFGPVWSVLYVMIGAAGWLVSTSGRSTAAVTLWWVQLALNFLWSPVFFALHRIGFALIVVSLLLGVIWTFVAMTARQSPHAALLFVPYGLWVAFATVLNASLYLLNRAD